MITLSLKQVLKRSLDCYDRRQDDVGRLAKYMKYKAYIFDWGNTLMVDLGDQRGSMYYWNRVVVCQNARETLAELSRIAPCYLATNADDSSKEDVRKALARGGLDAYITYIFSSRDLRVQKPSPIFFEKILETIKVPPQDLLMVGDSLENDYLWAIENGADAVLYDPKKRVIDSAIITISDLLELVPD